MLFGRSWSRGALRHYYGAIRRSGFQFAFRLRSTAHLSHDEYLSQYEVDLSRSWECRPAVTLLLISDLLRGLHCVQGLIDHEDGHGCGTRCVAGVGVPEWCGAGPELRLELEWAHHVLRGTQRSRNSGRRVRVPEHLRARVRLLDGCAQHGFVQGWSSLRRLLSTEVYSASHRKELVLQLLKDHHRHRYQSLPARLYWRVVQPSQSSLRSSHARFLDLGAASRRRCTCRIPKVIQIAHLPFLCTYLQIHRKTILTTMHETLVPGSGVKHLTLSSILM